MNPKPETQEEREASEQAYRKWIREEMELTEFVNPDAADDDIPEEDTEGDDE
jgi:hypothetical protein